jgi:2-polyprenyl-3-methyl-5-hydroxy-6-metoxy-1,4-benzoquinol methylase
MKLETAKKLLKLNYELYEKEAISWDKTRQELWEWPVIEELKKIKQGSSILDLGCGNGRIIKNLKLKIKNLKYVGIDPSKKLIEINKKRYSDAKVETNIRFEVGNGLALKDKNKYDFVFCLAVLHHIPSEKLQLKFLKNIYQTLRPKGKVLISLWNRQNDKYTHIRNNIKNDKIHHIICDLKKYDTIVPWKNSNSYRYIHCFRIDEIHTLVKKAGFSQINIFYADKKNITDQKTGLNIYITCKK